MWSDSVGELYIKRRRGRLGNGRASMGWLFRRHSVAGWLPMLPCCCWSAVVGVIASPGHASGGGETWYWGPKRQRVFCRQPAAGIADKRNEEKLRAWAGSGWAAWLARHRKYTRLVLIVLLPSKPSGIPRSCMRVMRANGQFGCTPLGVIAMGQSVYGCTTTANRFWRQPMQTQTPYPYRAGCTKYASGHTPSGMRCMSLGIPRMRPRP